MVVAVVVVVVVAVVVVAEATRLKPAAVPPVDSAIAVGGVASSMCVTSPDRCTLGNNYSRTAVVPRTACNGMDAYGGVPYY